MFCSKDGSCPSLEYGTGEIRSEDLSIFDQNIQPLSYQESKDDFDKLVSNNIISGPIHDIVVNKFLQIIVMNGFNANIMFFKESLKESLVLQASIL